MPDTPTILDMMSAYALDAVGHAKTQGLNLDFSAESVRSVENLLGAMYDARPKGFLARLFSRGPNQDVLFTFAKMYGGYVGEVLRRSSGGEWFIDQSIVPGQHTVGLRHGDHTIWPPSKVGKRLLNGPEDNVWHYFQVVFKDWHGAV